MVKAFVHIVRKRAMGDVLWIEPVIRQLAEKYKTVTVHTRNNVLFENYPLTNVVFKDRQNLLEKIGSKLAYWFPRIPFFINLDKSYEKNPMMPILHAYQLKAGMPLTNQYPNLYLSKKEKNTPIITKTKYVVLHLESYSDRNYRQVYGIEWHNITAYLADKGYMVIQLGKESAGLPHTTYVKTSIREMISLIAKSSMFIGIDSGPSHIATSFGIPSLIFFGAVNPLFRHFPETFNGYFLQQYCEYAGCFHVQSNLKEPVCRLVGNDGIPKCALHSDDYLIEHINKLIDKPQENDRKSIQKNKA